MSRTKQPLIREFWRREERRVWVHKQPRWGRGWTINWATVADRMRPRRPLLSTESREKPNGEQDKPPEQCDHVIRFQKEARVPTNRKLFVNLPVEDLDRSIAFFSELGFGFEDGFTDETAACMRIGEDAYVMLLVKTRFANFTGTQMCDPATQTDIILGISAATRGAVDGLANTALRIGATSAGETQDHGFMYSRSFQDPDGHHWEVVWMDQAVVAQALEDSASTG